jgi:hypothetical protein
MKFLRDVARYTLKDQIRNAVIRNPLNALKLNNWVGNNKLNKEPGSLSLLSDGLRSGRVDVRFLVGAKDFSFSQIIQTGFEAYTVSCVTGTRDSFPGVVNRLRREASHSPTSSAEVKNGEDIPPLPDTFSWCGA